MRMMVYRENHNLYNTKLFYSGITLTALIIYIIFYFMVCDQGTVHDTSKFSLRSLCLILLVVYAYGVYAWIKVSNRITSPFLVLWLSCFAFNAGQVFLYVFDIPVNNWYVVFSSTSDTLLFKAIAFETLCILGLLFGAIVATQNMDFLQVENYEKLLLTNNGRLIDKIDIVFLMLSLVVILLSVTGIFSRSVSAYGEVESSSGYTYFIVYFFNILLFYELYRHTEKVWTKLLLIIGGFRIICMFLMGARYNVIPLILGMAFVLLIARNTTIKLKVWQIICIIVGVLLFTSLMRGWTILRQYSLSSLSWDRIKAAYSSGLLSGFYDTLAETGNCIQPLTKTITIIDAGQGTGDNTVLYACLASIFPKKIISLVGYNPTITSLSSWITSAIGVKDGQGYSIFAEAYFNFQSLGFVFMIAFGYIYSKSENLMVKLFQSDSFLYTLLGCGILYLLGYESFLARADLILMCSYIRFCIYIYVLIIISQRGKIYRI